MISFFISIWDTFVYKPAYNLVIYSYHLSPGPNLGVAIIGIAILIRFIFLYFTLRGYQQDAVLEKVQPEIDRIEADQKLSSKEKYQKISSITSPLGINPFYESIPIFAQAIFLVALYQIFQVGIAHPDYKDLYGFVAPPTSINTNFFGFNLAQPALLLSLLGSGVLLIERVWEYNEKKHIPAPQSLSQKWDPLILPIISFIMLMLLPSAKAVFIATSVLFSLAIKATMHLAHPKS